MHIAVLCSPDSWYLKDLRRAAAERIEITPLTFRQLTAELAPAGERFTSGGIDLARVDAVLVRTMPPGTLEQVVFRMDMLGRLEAAGKVVINPARAVEAAVDKYLASARLAQAGLRTPRTIVCQTADDALQAFERLGGDVVLKPLFGAEGRGIVRLNDEALAQRAFSLLAQLGSVLYVQEFVPHDGHDLRVLVVGKRMWAMRRRNPLDWRTNVSRGATAEPVELTPELADLARRAADAIDAPLAGVDLLPGRDGQLYAIEVNAVPGWQALARTLKVDIAGQVLRYVESRVQGAD
ncbi:MAG TPA: RimK family alpha-L-glutamate ligase [Pirellulales bacterium]|jgi:ribosomal protein S6--L-glutamate ligase|nr:RimK family alpha-L-glutamate ligase [Pirellulales bacterium]